MDGRARPSWWLRLGGPNAVSLPAWLLTLPGAVLTTPTVDGGVTGDELVGWFLLGGVAHVLSGAVLWSAWLTVLNPGSRPSRPRTYVVVVLAAGIVRGAFLGVASVSLGLAESANLPLRLVAAPWLLLLWFSLATLIVDASRQHRAVMAALRRALLREQDLVEESASHLREYRAATVARVSETVAAQLAGAAALTADPGRASAQLRAIVEDVVRPLSHELQWRSVQDDRLLEEAAEAGEPSAVPLRDYVDAALTYRPFSPALTGALVLGSSAILSLYAIGPWMGLLFLCTDVLSVIGATTAARALLVPRLTRWALGVRVIAVGVAVCVVSAVNGLAVVLLLTLAQVRLERGFSVPRWVTLVSVAVVALGALSAAMAVGAVAWRRRQAEDALRQTTESVERIVSRLRQQAFVEQQQLSRLLHGEVQARIVSLALQLQLDPPDDPGRAIAELDARIQRALGEEDRAAWREHLAEVEGMWSHVITLDVRVEPAVADLLDGDRIAAQATVTVVREAVTNAVRHGGADAVDVVVRLDDGLVTVDVADDGSVGRQRPHRGMGSRMYDSVCLDWSLRIEPRGARLRARIATEHGQDRVRTAVAARGGGAVP